MKMIKLTALTSLLFVFIIGTSSCEKNAEKKKTTDYSRNDIPMTGAQVVPGTATTALGSMDVFYTKETRILTYTVRWSGLTDSVSLVHIHGLAASGFSAGLTAVQNIVAASNGIFAQKTSGKYTFYKSGTLTGTLLADGVLVKEQDILNGNYYIDIHSSGVYNTNGEIRGQIKFQ